MLYIIAGKNYPLTNLLLSEIENSEVTLIQNNSFYNYTSNFKKFMGKLCFALKIKNKNIFSESVYSKFSKIKKEDKILLWDIVKADYIFFIQNTIASKNISLWVWNKITTEQYEIEKIKKMGVEIFTFDKSDASIYGLKLKNQVCYNIPNMEIKPNPNKTDIYFVGFDKGRSIQIHNLFSIFKEKKITCDFTIIPDNSTKITFDSEIKTHPINFQTNISNIMNAKCLLDITKKEQIGITVRALEAMLFHKKLITDNKNIVSAEFYNKQNIFILGFDDMNTLPAFINSDFVEVNQEKLKEYYINDWIKSFI